MKTRSRASHRRERPRPGSCCSRPPRARSSTPGRSAGCAAPAVTMWWCAMCFVPIDYGSGFADPHVLPEPRYRIPAFSRVIPGLGAMALGHRPDRDRHLHRHRRCEDAAADDPDAPGQSWCTGSGVAGGITRAFGAAISVRQPGSAVAHADRDGRGHDGGAGACSACRIACRFQRRASRRSRLYRGWREFALRGLPVGTRLSRRACDHLHIGVHPRVMETTGRVLFGLEPDTPLL